MLFLAVVCAILVRNVLAGPNCTLTKDVGYNCKDEQVNKHFYYDARSNACQPLFYRGCGGNDNRFTTRAACERVCKYKKPEGEKVVDPDDMTIVTQCNLLTDAKIDETVKSCDEGCQIGYKCNKKNYCCPMKEYICTLPASSGTEREAFKHYGRYSYSPGLKNCIRFSYFGKEGNYNNFLTYNDCMKYCKKQKE